MYKTRKKAAFILINGAVLLLSVFISLFLVRRYAANTSPVILAGVPALVFLVFLVSGSVIGNNLNTKLRKNILSLVKQRISMNLSKSFVSAILMMTFIKLLQISWK